MTVALEGGEWSAARPGRTLLRGKSRYPFYRRLVGSQGRSGRAENLVHTGIFFPWLFFYYSRHNYIFDIIIHTMLTPEENSFGTLRVWDAVCCQHATPHTAKPMVIHSNLLASRSDSSKVRMSPSRVDPFTISDDLSILLPNELQFDLCTLSLRTSTSQYFHNSG